jgi:zinc/manganese transport system permease protein
MGWLALLASLPGNGPVRTAVLVGGVAAAASSVVGVFTVIRGQSFAGHALADMAVTGGSGAFLLGLSQFWGFVTFAIGAAAFMEAAGVERRRGRDVVTGVVQGAGLGVAALFLYLATQTTTTTGATYTVLFGSMFTIEPSTIPSLLGAGALALASSLVLSRVLLLSSLSPELASARGVPVRAVSTAYLIVLAISVALSAVAIGAVLSTALLIGPAAIALRLTRGPIQAMAAAVGTAVGATWLGIVLAYVSYWWPPRGHGWPVSFFVVALVVLLYVLVHLPRGRQPRTRWAERSSAFARQR